jgi:hypothetical protein
MDTDTTDVEEDKATNSDEDEEETAGPIDPAIWTAASQGLPLPNTGWPCDVPTALRLVEVAMCNDWGQTVADLCAILSNQLGCRLVEEFLPRFGDTLLAFAALHGSVDAATSLLQIKACVNASTDTWMPPLAIAMEPLNLGMVRLLVECKGDVNANDGGPLQVAAIHRDDDVACTELLLGAKALVDMADGDDGQTALHCASSWGERRHSADARWCQRLRHCARLQRDTALIRACEKGNVAVAQVLLQTRVRVGAVNGAAPLFYAATSDHASVTSALIRAKADVRTAACILTRMDAASVETPASLVKSWTTLQSTPKRRKTRAKSNRLCVACC